MKYVVKLRIMKEIDDHYDMPAHEGGVECHVTDTATHSIPHEYFLTGCN